jgi:radical SAM superfamily enzyme YgiQ (UPF0313 family)
LKIELIVPATRALGKGWRLSLCPPLAPAALAALTPPGVDVSITDENVSAIDFEKRTDLVGITVLTSTAVRAYEIADEYRRRGVTVVLGGIHPSVLPEEASAHADAVVVGEAELTWPQLVADFQAGRIEKIYRQEKRPNLTGLPVPRRELYRRGRYVIPETISTTRGCPYACTFCSVSLFAGRTYRCRPVAEVVAEARTLSRRRPVIIVDDNIVGKPAYAKELFRALVPLKLKWIGQASVNVASDDELLALAAASGCRGLLIGFESVAPGTLVKMGKKINRVDEYWAAVAKLHARGIAVHGAFVFGLDEDDPGIFERTVSFARQSRLESVQFSVVIPHPGTALFNELDMAGRITSKDWSRYDSKVVFQTRSLTPEALADGTHRALTDFFSLKSAAGRLGFPSPKNLPWWGLNLFFHLHFRATGRKGGALQ